MCSVENVGGRIPNPINPLNILVQFDGNSDLVDIASKLNLNFLDLLKYTQKFLENNLVRKI